LSPAYFFSVAIYFFLTSSAPDNNLILLFHHFTYFVFTTDLDIVYALNPAFLCLPLFITFFLTVAFSPVKPSVALVAVFFVVAQVPALIEINLLESAGTIPYAFVNYFYIFLLGGLIKKAPKLKLLKSQRYTLTILSCVITLLIALGFKFGGSDVYWSDELNLSVYQNILIFIYATAFYVARHVNPPQNHLSNIIGFYASISFNLYLIHNVMYHFVPPNTGTIGLCISFAASIGLAIAMAKLIEEPSSKLLSRILPPLKSKTG